MPSAGKHSHNQSKSAFAGISSRFMRDAPFVRIARYGGTS
jgi:hypothetical protein